MFTVMMIKGWFIGRMIDVVQVLYLRTDSLITAPNDDQRPASSRAALTTERWNRQTDRRTDIHQTESRHTPTRRRRTSSCRRRFRRSYLTTLAGADAANASDASPPTSRRCTCSCRRDRQTRRTGVSIADGERPTDTSRSYRYRVRHRHDRPTSQAPASATPVRLTADVGVGAATDKTVGTRI